MNRFRWYVARWPTPIADLAARLGTLTYADGAADGFVLDRVRASYVEGRYYERVELREVVKDPLGSEFVVERLSFNSASFRLSDEELGLEIGEGHKVVRSLVSRLSAAADFGVAISPISIDPERWANAFAQVADVNCSVEVLQIGLPEVFAGVSGRLNLKGKAAISAASDIVGDRKKTIEKLQLKLPKFGSISFSSSGQASISMSRVEEWLPKVRSALAKARNWPPST